MSFTVTTLCRGAGKGYICVASETDPDGLRARAVTGDGTELPCPLYRIGFPGEDSVARRHWGEEDAGKPYSFVLAVPLFDHVSLSIQLISKASGEIVYAIPFGYLATRIRSRMTYKLKPQAASAIRDIDQRRLSGGTYLYVTGIYPVEEHEVSCRVCVRFPMSEDANLHSHCNIEVFDSNAKQMDVVPVILEDSVIPDPHDSQRKMRQLLASIRVPDSPTSLCITAHPDGAEPNFVGIPASTFSGFISGAHDYTKYVTFDDGYDAWFEQHRATYSDVRNERESCEQWSSHPLISIVTVVYNTPATYLHALIESFKAQSYEHFEVIFVNVSDVSEQIDVILGEVDDARFRAIRAENKSIAENTNVGIKESVGDYIAFVDHDDVIEPDALYRYVCAIQHQPEADLLYCDEDLLDESGRYSTPMLKPDFNQDLLDSYNYVTHMLVVSKEVLNKVELSPADVSGAQDYDLTLKCAERARAIVHVPKILYHWRTHRNSTSINPDSKPYAQQAGRLALMRHYQRIGIPAIVEDSERHFHYRAHFPTAETRWVNIVIPLETEDTSFVSNLRKLLAVTEYNYYDITIVVNNDKYEIIEEKIREVAGSDISIHLVSTNESSHAALCNAGASKVNGDLLLFLDGDAEVANQDWLRSMANFFARPEVGVVGAKLLDHDGLVQHGGMWISPNGIGNYGDLMSYKDDGYLGTLLYPWDCAAVDGSCQMIRRSTFFEIGSFDKRYASGIDAIDFCMRARQHGYSVVFDPQSVLYHKRHAESASVNDTSAGKACQHRAAFHARWDGSLKAGEFTNPNLNQYDGHFKLRW